MIPKPLLDGRTIVITGAATGIGQAFALACAAHGANVVVADLNDAEETVAGVERAGTRALPVRVDVSDRYFHTRLGISAHALALPAHRECAERRQFYRFTSCDAV